MFVKQFTDVNLLDSYPTVEGDVLLVEWTRNHLGGTNQVIPFEIEVF